jgi:NAD(P)H-nitrite reductase large subunit
MPLAIDLDPDATACICEDVTVAAIDRAIADGFGDIELLKRRSGACTGACQGKLCLGPVGEVLRTRGLAAGLPTIRPPIRPVSIASLAGEMG